MARTKLTEEMVGQAIRLKADGLSNGDIICALGIHESTFYRWIGNPRGRLQRALCEGLKKEEASFKQTLLTTIRAAALARNQYWTAAAWLLERKYPDEYGKADRQRDDRGEGDAPRIVLGDVMAHGHSHYWMDGGRGSTKSSFISVAIVLLLLAHPEANAVVVRRFSNTLRDSVFEQMQWAVAELLS